MKTNYHTHTTRCMHATGDDEDYVLSAIKGGYRILGFSDHTPWKYRTDYVADMRMLPEELPGYVESLKTLREKYHDRIDIRIGLECEYFPQYIHWLKEQIKKYQLDYIIFGNHHYHTDEKFPYFGHHTDSRDMLDSRRERHRRYGKRIILLALPIRTCSCVPIRDSTTIALPSAGTSAALLHA